MTITKLQTCQLSVIANARTDLPTARIACT